MRDSIHSEQTLRGALQHQPDNTQIRLRLGAILVDARRYDEAERVFREGLELGDRNPALMLQHAECLLDLHQVDAAISQLREVLVLDPDHGDALASLGGALLRTGAMAEAAGVLERAAKLLPHDGLVHELWGEALAADDASAAFRVLSRAWELGRRTRAMAFYCGNVACEQGKFALATHFFVEGLTLPGDDPPPWHNLGKAWFELGDVAAATAALRQAPESHRSLALRNLALMIPGDPTATPHDILRVRQQYAAQIALDLPAWEPSAQRASLRSGPCRVGYISSFFAHPNYMKPVYAVLRAHDARRVEVELFHDGPPSRDLTQCVSDSAVSVVHEVSKLNNLELVELVRKRNLDVLVDLNAYSAMPRLPIYTVRLAPRVIGWFNHYATSALPGIDLLCGDLATIDDADFAHFSEKMVRLPLSYLAFQVPHAAPDLVDPPCCRNGYITFGSLCTQYKITPPVIQAWADMLRAIPDSRLLLANRTLEAKDVADYVRQSFARQGVDPELLILRGGAAHLEYLQNYNDIDIALDAWPYNGGTTTSEAIWQGVPVLTFRGDRWASRTSASLLVDGPFATYVRASAPEMVQHAISLAVNPELPAELKRLRHAARIVLASSPVCDAKRLAETLEDVYTCR